MTAPEINPRDLRVSDAEREHTMKLLERATGRGLINIEEYSERTSKVIRAKTRADLNVLLLDLPGLQLAGQPFESSAAQPAAPWIAPAPGEVLELKGYGSRQFSGNWVVPRLITVAGTGASTKLDFTQARLTSHTVTIEFRSNFGGSMHLMVPAGTEVHHEGLDLRSSSFHTSLAPFSGPAPLVLNLVGILRHGSIHIRQPKKGGLRRLIDGVVDSTR